MMMIMEYVCDDYMGISKDTFSEMILVGLLLHFNRCNVRMMMMMIMAKVMMII